METIRVKYLKDITKLEKISVGDWIDLRCAETTTLSAGEYALIPLGVAMELPKGYEAIVAPRSSTFKKYGMLLANSIGIIDESYCGDNDEWRFLAYATRGVVIEKDERICQFRIIKHQPEIQFEEVEELGNADRGGIGSTDAVKSTQPITMRLSANEKTEAGKSYKVVYGNRYFKEGDIVIALESDSAPYCVYPEKYVGNELSDYEQEHVWSIAVTSLAKFI